MSQARLVRLAPDLAIGATVALVGAVEVWTRAGVYILGLEVALHLVVVFGIAVAAGLARGAPGWALLVVWGVCGFQLFGSVDILLTQLAVGIVAYGTARFGSTGVLWASGLSIPFGALLGLIYARDHAAPMLDQLGYYNQVVRFGLFGTFGLLSPALLAGATLVVPWLLGIARRALAAARVSREGQVAAEQDAARAILATEQATEIAELRAEQARLARDVHDVVGHSLAVILAQAEAAQFLPDEEADRVQQTLSNIATTARSSLRDVREVLASTGDSPGGSGSRVGELDTLVQGIQAAGNDVRSSVVGRPQPLPPELAVVAFRVLQEMLTNAIKHGRRGAPVHVEQHWEGELRIEVRNLIEESAEPAAPTGLGVDGMTRRLESVGGRLDVRRRHEDGVGQTWTATAWVPIRSQPR